MGGRGSRKPFNLSWEYPSRFATTSAVSYGIPSELFLYARGLFCFAPCFLPHLASPNKGEG